jgi:glucose-6-phosphate isomerase
LPERVGTYVARAGELAGVAHAEGLQDVVVIGMGGPNLAAETLLNTSAEKHYRRVFVLVAIRAVDEQLDHAATLFVVVDKSGKRFEIHTLLLYFLNRLKALRISDPGLHFVAVAEKDSYLAELASNYGFLETFLVPPGIKVRYSSLLHFGLLSRRRFGNTSPRRWSRGP